MTEPLDERQGVMQHIGAAEILANAAKRRAIQQQGRPAPPPPPTPAAVELPSDLTLPTLQRTITADPGILGFIGPDDRFFLSAPVFPTADGPSADETANSDTVVLTWKWDQENTQLESDADDARNFTFLREWGRVARAVSTPPSTLTVKVRLPQPYRIAHRTGDSWRRADDSMWAYYSWATTASLSNKQDVVTRIRSHGKAKKEADPSV